MRALYWDIDLELHITLLALQFHLLEESHGRVWDNEKIPEQFFFCMQHWNPTKK